MKFSLKTLLFALALALAPQAAAQGARDGQGAGSRGAGQSPGLERRAEAEAKVVVSVCVTNGDVVVRGWDRREVRARAVEAGTLRLLTPNVTPAPRVEVLVSQDRDRELGPGDCGTADRVELTVPRGATVNVQSQSGHVEVADVAEARVRVLSGDVDLRGIAQSVEVSCLSGDISIADSSGPVRVNTVSGDVEARNLRRLSTGDRFEAKSTSGDVTIEGVTHGQVTVSGVSGRMTYTGALARGGSYDFRTISGDVIMELPADSSFNVHARVVASGEINTDFPVRTTPGPPAGAGSNPPAPPATPGPVVVVTPTPGAHNPKKPGKVTVHKEHSSARLDGTVGTGDAVVNLSSFSGSLYLRRR